MLLIGIDSSGKQGGLALARADAHQFQLLGTSAIAGGLFSAQLVPAIADLLTQHNLSKREIEGICVASGPGSFTGLRVGLAAAKGLAEALGLPVATVSLLEALALASAQIGRITVALDAGRNEVYLGEYEGISDTQANCIREWIVPLASLPQAARLYTPDATVIEAAAAQDVTVVQVARPDAASIVRLGLAKLLRGEAANLETLDANYLRRSDAELYSSPKQR